MNDQKTIAIATLWGELNYGAFLQAYALSNFLEKCGNTTFFFRETCKKMNILSLVSKKPQNMKQNIYNVKLYKKFQRSQQTLLTLGSLGDSSDVCIVGADEVWNINNPNFEHLDCYVGKNVNSRKVIAYAPSGNGTMAKDFFALYGEDCFDNFNEISVRDSSTEKMVKEITRKQDVPIVLDPTFLLDAYVEIEEDVLTKKYLLVYGYSFSKVEINAINEYAQKHSLITISVGPFHSWTNVQIPASPQEFLGLVKNAECVITSTFHGTVFSIIYNKQFISYVRNEKIRDLLEDFNLTERGLTQQNIDIDKLFKNKIHYDRINELIACKRRFSRNVLISSILETGIETK